MATLDQALLADYADAFRTRGPLSNPVWFLVPEEDAAVDLDAASRRILAWDRAGRPTGAAVGAAARAAAGAGADRAAPGDPLPRIDGRATASTTRSNLARVLLGLCGEPLDAEAGRRAEALGRDGQACLMTLFPLPAPEAGAWFYGRVPHDPAADGPDRFASRRAYREHYLPRRLDAIVSLVGRHRPEALVCTSWTHRGQLRERLEDVELPDLGLEGTGRRALIGRLGDTVVAVCTDPARRAAGPRNAFYHRLGRAVAERVPPAARALAA